MTPALVSLAHAFDTHVDWFRVIVDLNRAGYRVPRIAIEIGSCETTVYGWKSLGARPRYEEGDRLLALWERVTAKSRESVPMMNRYSAGSPPCRGA